MNDQCELAMPTLVHLQVCYCKHLHKIHNILTLMEQKSRNTLYDLRYILLTCHAMNSFASVQMVSWWWGSQSWMATDVLRSCLAILSLCQPWTTCGILTQAVVVLQFNPSSSPSLPHRAHSVLVGALHPAMMTTASRVPVSSSYTCMVDLLFQRALTVVQQAAWLTRPTGCRWNLACHVSHLPHLLSSHHTSRHLAACCTLLLSSINALSHSERWDIGKSKLSGALCG